MGKRVIKVATRKSQLALWQANFVASRIESEYPDIEVKLIPMSTKGDKILDTPLAKIGGKGLFIKELELGMLQGEADIAVHSMKDVPMELPEGFELPVVCRRENPLDAYVSRRFAHMDDLPQGAVVGTSSLRRSSQLLHIRPDLEIQSLRGNVQTRLGKLDSGEYDAIILASAGLIRLNLKERIRHSISSNLLLPAVGQGAVGIECREGDEEVKAAIAFLDDEETHRCVAAERAFNRYLEGGCQVPIAGYAEQDRDKLSMRALVASTDGSRVFSAEDWGLLHESEELGVSLAKELLRKGAGDVLESLHING